MDSLNSPEVTPRDKRLSLGKDLVFLALVTAWLIWRGWQRFTHPVIDFGRELYVPWQLLEGKVLFGELAYFNGPLSPYFNALGFQILGVSLTALVVLNISIIVGSALLLYSLIRRLTGRFEAIVACLIFLVVFATADLIGFGNYNFVTPYSPEMTHGTILSLALLLVVSRYFQDSSKVALATSGLLLGLIFLTKAEFFVAAGGALILVFMADAWSRRSSLLRPIRPLSVIGMFALLPPLIAWAALSLRLGIKEALFGVLGAWPYVLLSELSELPFYRKGMGLDDSADSFGRMLIWTAIYLIALWPAYIAASLLKPTSRRRVFWSFVVGIWALVALIGAGIWFDPTDFPRPLPVVVVAAALLTMIMMRRRSPDDPLYPRLLGLFALQILALGLLAKMALHPRYQHYGFALAMPATMVLVLTLVFLLPETIRKRGGYGPAFRLAGLMFLLVVGVGFSLPSRAAFRHKTLPFGQDADQILVHPRFVVMQQLLEYLRSEIEENETLLVLPEGIMFNYQIRRRTPTAHINFMPPEFVMFGEDSMLAALEKTPPDAVVLVKRSTHEYGYESFGSGYGEGIMEWLDRNEYEVVATLTEPQLDRHEFGRALVLRPTALP